MDFKTGGGGFLPRSSLVHEKEQRVVKTPPSRPFFHGCLHYFRRFLCTSCVRYLATYRPLIDKMLEGAFRERKTAVPPI